MKILKCVREDKVVIFTIEVEGHKSTEEREIKAHEAPLASFDEAMQKLVPVACKVMEFPPDYKQGMIVKSVTVSHTKNGTRSVVIKTVKTLDTVEKVHPIATPMFQIDDAASGEDTRKDVTKGQAELVASFLHEVEKYANGERQQRLLPLDDAGAPTTAQEDPENVLKFNTPTKGDDGEGKKAPKKKPVKKVAKKKSTARPKA